MIHVVIQITRKSFKLSEKKMQSGSRFCGSFDRCHRFAESTIICLLVSPLCGRHHHCLIDFTTLRKEPSFFDWFYRFAEGTIIFYWCYRFAEGTIIF
jgi:hypothetical protein